MNFQESTGGVSFLSAGIILGFTSMAAQIVLFREMMVAFYGNELILGVMLCVWLFWVGVGSAVGNKILVGRKHPRRRLSFWYLLISIAILATVVSIRFSKQILGTAPAEVVGFFPMLLFALVVLCPLCLILGITFVLNSKSWALDETLVFSVNRVYLWESLGAALAGLTVTFVLIPSLSNFTIVFLLIFLNVVFWAFLVTHQQKQGVKVVVWIVLALVIAGFFLSNLGLRIDGYTATGMWRNLPLVFSKDTRYGNVAVTLQDEQITFYENGLMLFSCPDAFSAEEAVHFALLEHPHPRSLLLIGGGMGGALSQSLQYDSLRIEYVEIDPELIGIGREYLPETERRSLDDPRVRIHFLDGRLFVKSNLKAGRGERYDVIILNLPDPSTAQLNRLYTVEFLRMVRSTLNQGGVFSFRVSSAENYISRELSLYLSSLYRTLTSVFDQVKVLPGANAVFLASNNKGALFDDWSTLVARLNKREITTQFVNENFLQDRLSPLRLALLNQGLSEREGRVNSDLEPICYFYNSILWSKQFNSLEKPLLLRLSGLDRGWLVAATCLLFALIFSFCLMSRSRPSHLALASIFTAGFTSILVEIMVVLSFQTFHGYIYSMIGLIFTLFMLGLFLGALLVQKMVSLRGIDFTTLVRVQMIQVIFLLVFIFVITFLARTFAPDTVVVGILLLIISVSGLLGGMLFALANHLFISRRSVARSGTGYAFDLFGSALSSLLASAVLIPLLGIPNTLAAMVLVNLVCLFTLLAGLRIS